MACSWWLRNLEAIYVHPDQMPLTHWYVGTYFQKHTGAPKRNGRSQFTLGIQGGLQVGGSTP